MRRTWSDTTTGNHEKCLSNARIDGYVLLDLEEGIILDCGGHDALFVRTAPLPRLQFPPL